MTYEKRIVRIDNKQVKIVVKHLINGNITRVIHSVFLKVGGKWQSPVATNQLVKNGVGNAPEHVRKIYLEHVSESEINDAIIESFEHVKKRRYVGTNN